MAWYQQGGKQGRVPMGKGGGPIVPTPPRAQLAPLDPAEAEAAAKLAQLKKDLDPTPRAGETEKAVKIRVIKAKMKAEGLAKAGLCPALDLKAMAGQDAPAAAQVWRPGQQRQQPVAVFVDPAKVDADGKKMEVMLALLEQKLSVAEDEADKVIILAAPLAMEASEDLRAVQTSAIRDTERAVKAAQVAIMDTRREVEKKKKDVEAFAPTVRDTAKEELSKLAPRIEACAGKVDEHKNVRRDHEQAVAAERLFGELATRVAGVEVDCEKAAMMAEPLAKVLTTDPESISAAELRETKEALRVASATLAPTMRLISGKVVGLKGHIRKKMEELHARAESSQTVLDRAQLTVDEAQSRAQAAPILRETSSRIEQVEQNLMQMRETESPFLMGIEVMPADESTEVLKRMESAAAAAHAALADALKFVSLRMVDVGRFAEGASNSARRELERAKQQLDDGVNRVRAFQEEASKRKRQNLVVLVKERIEEAESAVLKMQEAGSQLPSVETDGVAEALQAALAAEVLAQNAVTTARRELQDKHQDLRPHEGANADVVKNNSELLRTKVRINYMESELNKFRKMAKGYEEKIKVSRSLVETSAMLDGAEQEVDRLVEASKEWPTDEKPPAEGQEAIQSVQSKLTSTTNQVEMKLQNAQGLELKELKGIFARLQNAQGKLETVKELARQRTKSLSGKVVKAASDAVRQAEQRVAAVSAEASVAEIPTERLQELNDEARAALIEISAAQRSLADSQGSQLALESKVEFARLQLRIKGLERKGRIAADKVMARYKAIADEAEHVALEALRNASRKDADGDRFNADSLFKTVSDGKTTVSEEQFCDFLAQVAPSVTTEKAKVAFSRIAPHGLSRRNFASALSSFMRVTREIALTDNFEIQTSKKIRKLEVGELIEATGAPNEDGALGLTRIQCRVLKDGTSGWVTSKSAGGAPYLERAAKPYLWCLEATSLRQSKEDASKAVAELVRGDVLELLEGPRQERLSEEARVRGVACHEEAVGWLQVKNRKGDSVAALSDKVHKCSEAIAMTDVADFASCTMVRRIEAGEALERLPEAEVTPSDGVARQKFRACADGREGWVTVKGCQGTVYVRPVPKHFLVTEATPMHAGLSAESPVVRVLMPGEAFSAFEEPREVCGGDCLSTYRVRSSVGDGAEGWVTSTVQNEVQAWTPKYKVLRASPLTATLSANEAAEPVIVARVLEPGEIVEVTEQPAEDRSTGMLRVRCIAAKDKALGWATVREAGGAGALLLMEPVIDVEGAGEAAPSTPPQGGKGAKRGVKEEAEESGKGKGKGKGFKGKFKAGKQ